MVLGDYAIMGDRIATVTNRLIFHFHSFVDRSYLCFAISCLVLHIRYKVQRRCSNVMRDSNIIDVINM